VADQKKKNGVLDLRFPEVIMSCVWTTHHLRMNVESHHQTYSSKSYISLIDVCSHIFLIRFSLSFGGSALSTKDFETPFRS